ncbi:MAG: MotA/TolQ/ExbB proton channel family protein [Gammaproteobacteria bacterium]|nr:MotA/TolQ/ExbB proton channel family protein [Gammaproteobacteria bacterium]MDH5692906.1 MotA/TolQ/ExbB proton channel family protein [Gammaproteobacteria bacterium]
MNRAHRTFVVWLLWASAATIIYLGLYVDTDILAFLSQDKSKITWIITALFIIGVLTSFFLTIRLTSEGVEITRQEYLAQEKGLMGVEASHRKKRAVNRFFDSLKVVAACNESPDFDSLISMEYAVYYRISHAIEVLGNLLITLGLIGTVMGLTLTLTGLTSSLDALGTDQDLLLEGLRKAMSGMGTAFYTTLLGAVLGGVLLRIFALITENGITSLHEQLNRICMVYLAPDFKPSMERDVRFLNVEIEALGQRITALQNAFKDSKSSIVEFHEAIKDLYKVTGDDGGTYTLKETLRMQRFYRALLKQELQLMHSLNRSWWTRFKLYLERRKD